MCGCAIAIFNMSKETLIVSKIKALKASKGFVVKTNSERQNVCRVAKLLKDNGIIEFDVVTKKEGDTFKVAAI